MESLDRKPPTLLPDRAQRWTQLQQSPRPAPSVRFREGKSKTRRVSGRLVAAHTQCCHRDTGRSGRPRATPTKHRVRSHRRQGAGRVPAPAAPLRLEAGPRRDSRSGLPTPPEPQPPVTSFIHASQRPGFAGSPGASRAPAEPAGPGSPGPRAPAAQKPRRRGGPPPRKQLPRGARLGTSPPRRASGGRGCGRRCCRLSAPGGRAHRAQRQFRLRRPGGDGGDGARGGAGRTARGAGRGGATRAGTSSPEVSSGRVPPRGAAIGQQRARALARTDAGRGPGAGLRRR